jgi:hypothetical protein
METDNNQQAAGSSAAPCSADYGCDPLGDGLFKMVPSGDVVDLDERDLRLGKASMEPRERIFGMTWDELEKKQGGRITRDDR